MPNDIRIAIQDDATLVWIRESNDVAGWRHNRFDSFPEALDFITRWSWGQFCTRRWEPGDPPDVAEIERLKLDIEVIRADEANANYWAGQDVGAAGVYQRWEEALSDEATKAGVMAEPIESLYRRTVALREHDAWVTGVVIDITNKKE